jgi:flagellum-specific peptidoglycan hydrolase FlgJ
MKGLDMAITLAVLRQQIRERKQALGITEAEIRAARNAGLRRSPEKRAFLARIQARARAAGQTPVPAEY